MTLPAFQLGEEFFAMLDALHGQWRFRGHRDFRTRFFGGPARRESFDESDQVSALLVRQGNPGRHIGIIEAANQRTVQIVVGGKSASRGGAALECRRDEIARQDIQVRSILSATVAAESVAAPTIAIVKLFASGRMAGNFTYVRFTLLRRGNNRNG